jgi:hypothetical protein
MPMTQTEHDRNLKAPAVCELLPLRDLPMGDDLIVHELAHLCSICGYVA